MHSISDWVYQRSPVMLQNEMCFWYGKRQAVIRFSSVFHERFAQLLESENWSAAEIEAYQDEQVRRIVRHTYTNVPYYRERMKRLRLAPDDIRGRSDLAKLPILTKEEVRQNVNALISERADRRALIFAHTSGTTGKSLQFYTTPSATAFLWAVWWRHRHRFGIPFGAWHANFTGKLVVPERQKKPPYWRFCSPLHQILLNMHHLRPAAIRPIVDFLNSREFEFYSGYPSIVHALALTAMEQGCRLTSRPRFVVTGAENVLEQQRRDISEFTGAVLTDQYGFSEGCGNASHCPELVYHEDFELGVLECVDPEPIGGARQKGKIVCTGFANPDFPFIRYEVGDVGIWEDPMKACKCGRHSRVIVAIDGRIDDFVITPEGRRIMRFDYIFKDTQNVKEAQIVQSALGEITVRVVRRPSYGEKDEGTIAGEISKWISPALRVCFEYVGEIERERNGKFKAVKSLLKRVG